jgi:hypothetical protein
MNADQKLSCADPRSFAFIRGWFLFFFAACAILFGF